MKKLTIASALAALAALSVSSLRLESVVSLFVVAGVVAIVLSDYSRTVRPLVTAPAPVDVASRGRERFGLAA